MTTPAHCTSCGHELGVGRFCTNCGRPVPGRHPEAEPVDGARSEVTVVAPVAAPPAAPPMAPPVAPPAVTPTAVTPTAVTPPPAGAMPTAARYPLFADDQPPAVRPVAAPPAGQPASPPPLNPPPPPFGSPAPREERRAVVWWPWLVALVVLAIIAGIGAVLVLGGGDDSSDGDLTSANGDDRSDDASPDGGDTNGDDDPDSDTGPAPAPNAADITDLTSSVSATVPAVGAPSSDLAGKPVTFVAANMWDDKVATAWRMPGDGTGESVTFDLGAQAVLTEVGLINGYAKTDRGINWYRGNRRILQVEWVFDDGSTVVQDLDDQPDLQMLSIDPIRTGSVELRILAVSKPGKGPNGRDNTAISEVRFLGAS